MNPATHTVYMVTNVLGKDLIRPSSFLLPDLHSEGTGEKAPGHPVPAAVWGAAEQHQARCGVCDSSLRGAQEEPELLSVTRDHPARGEFHELWLT